MDAVPRVPPSEVVVFLCLLVMDFQAGKAFLEVKLFLVKF